MAASLLHGTLHAALHEATSQGRTTGGAPKLVRQSLENVEDLTGLGSGRKRMSTVCRSQFGQIYWKNCGGGACASSLERAVNRSKGLMKEMSSVRGSQLIVCKGAKAFDREKLFVSSLTSRSWWNSGPITKSFVPSLRHSRFSDGVASSQFCSSSGLISRVNRSSLTQQQPFYFTDISTNRFCRNRRSIQQNTIHVFSERWPNNWRSRRKISRGRLFRCQQSQSENLDLREVFTKSDVTADDSQTEDESKVKKLSIKFLGVNNGANNGSVKKSETWYQSIPKRWIVVILCFFAFLLCNMDRVNMSIAIMPMAAEFGWNSTTVGLVQSSFFWGYLLTQIAGGVWADKIGGKQVLGFGVVWWSLATMATPLAAKVGLPALFFVRACMGVGEGVAMPAMNNLLSRWIPVEERSRSLALVYSGMYLGSVIGLACSPSLIHAFGWPSVFISFGSVGAIWFGIWQRLAYSSPGEHPDITAEESKLILKDNKAREPLSEIPWRLLLSNAPVWALIISHFCHNWGTFILLTWMPTYYNQVLGFNLLESGLFSVLPWLTMAFSANVGGWIADTLVSKGFSITLVRKIMQSIGFLGPAFFLTQLSNVTSPALAVVCMMCSQGLDAFSQSGLYSNHQDIGPRYSGILLGLSNTAGVLAGVFGTAATGYILQHGSWDDVFKVAVALYLVGTIVWNIFATGEKQFD